MNTIYAEYASGLRYMLEAHLPQALVDIVIDLGAEKHNFFFNAWSRITKFYIWGFWLGNRHISGKSKITDGLISIEFTLVWGTGTFEYTFYMKCLMPLDEAVENFEHAMKNGFVERCRTTQGSEFLDIDEVSSFAIAKIAAKFEDVAHKYAFGGPKRSCSLM
jgi:hypothetical protein